jgi:hypothetical protein
MIAYEYFFRFVEESVLHFFRCKLHCIDRRGAFIYIVLNERRKSSVCGTLVAHLVLTWFLHEKRAIKDSWSVPGLDVSSRDREPRFRV